MVDNISTDIDFASIEEDHQKLLQLYKANEIEQKDDLLDTKPLIPLSTVFPKYPTERVSKGSIENVDPWDDMGGYDDEVTKYYNEPDPRGKTSKNTFEKKHSNWAAAWGDSSDGEIGDLWGDINCSDDELFEENTPTQMYEKAEEIEAAVDKISADVQEISRDMGELVPLVSDTNEDVRMLTSDLSKLNKRVTNIEHSLKKIEVGMDGINSLMQTIVDHFTDET